MFKRYRKFILLFAVVFLFLTFSHSAFALEATYPTIPNAPPIGTNSSLAEYIQYFFVFATAVAGIIGVISIVIGGIQILLAGGNPGAISAARERIFDSILGIILLMFSYIILNTINPQLTSLKVLGGPQDPGVYLIGNVTATIDNPDGIIYKQLGSSGAISDTSTIEAPYTQFKYICNPGGKKILLSVYDETDFNISRTENGGPNVNTMVVNCGDPAINIKSPILSFNWEYEEAGIYLYLTTDCTGIRTSVLNTTGEIPYFDYQDNLTQQVGSFRIVSGDDDYLRYGVIFSKTQDYNGGECTPPIINSQPGSKCYTMPTDKDFEQFNPSSMYVLHQDPFPKGRGVTLLSQNLELFLKQDTDIKDHYIFNGDPDNLLTGPNAGKFTSDFFAMEADECENPDVTCLKRVNHDGFYYTILYSENQKDFSRRCEVYLGGVAPNDLNTSGQLLGDDRLLYRMDIIPTLP